MKAQKQCPGCKNFSHARVASCPHCSHVFYEKKQTDSHKPKVEGAGPGRKICKNCNTFNGVRSAKCKTCGADFNKPVPTVKITPAQTEESPFVPPNYSPNKPVAKIQKEPACQSYRADFAPVSEKPLALLLIPAGKCIVPIKEWTEKGLESWAWAVQEEMKKQNWYLANEGLRYWALKQFDFWKDKDKDNLVRKVFPE